MRRAPSRVAKSRVPLAAVVVLTIAASCGGKVDSQEEDPDDNAGLYDACTGDCQRACEEPARIEALVQAGERLVEVAPQMKARIAAACASLAGVEPVGDVEQLCDSANTAVTAALSASGSVSVSTPPILCAVDVSEQVACEARCYVDSSCNCTSASVEERCEPGLLFGECAGTCLGECVGTLGDSGLCSGTCMGSCSEPFAEPRCGQELLPPSCACEGANECVATCGHLGALLTRCTPSEVQVVGNVDPAFLETLEQAMSDILESFEQMDFVLDAAVDFAPDLAAFGGSLSEPCLDVGGRRLIDLVAPVEDALSCLVSARSAFMTHGPTVEGQ